jgi:hypothetical protein
MTEEFCEKTMPLAITEVTPTIRRCDQVLLAGEIKEVGTHCRPLQTMSPAPLIISLKTYRVGEKVVDRRKLLYRDAAATAVVIGAGSTLHLIGTYDHSSEMYSNTTED